MEVLQDLLLSMANLGEKRYVEPAIVSRDPPDCTVRTLNGGRVAVEVSEFVSQEAIETNERMRRQLNRRPRIEEMFAAQWNEITFLEHLDSILARKDQRVLNGGPYDEVLVIVYEDELLLVREQCEQWLDKHTFQRFNQLTHGYFLFTYDPKVGGYPYRRLFGAA